MPQDTAKCARCPTEEPRVEYKFSKYPPLNWIQLQISSNPVENVELCPPCAKSFRKWLKNG